MANVYDFSFEEFEEYYNALIEKARRNDKRPKDRKKDPKEFSSIEEYYNASNAIEFFKNELLNH